MQSSHNKRHKYGNDDVDYAALAENERAFMEVMGMEEEEGED